MAHTLPTWSAPPVAGGWLFHSRTGVGQLARCATLDDVRSRFGSARTLTEQLLGFPLNGGHATKPMVRLVGELLHHRLGPAVAAEALAFVVEIQRMVPTATIERILRRYLDVSMAVGLPTETELSELVARLDATRGPARAAVAVDLCRPQGRERATRRQAVGGGWGEEYGGDYRPSPFFGHPSRWSSEDWMVDLYTRHSALVRRHHRAEAIDLDDHDEMVAMLWDNTDVLLARPDCPQELVEMIRHPYNEATLHLAIRAGGGCYEPARVKRMLVAADRPSVERIAEHSLDRLVVAVLQLGLVANDGLRWLLLSVSSDVWRRGVLSLGTPMSANLVVRTALADPATPPALLTALLLETPVLHTEFGQTPLVDDTIVSVLLGHADRTVRVAAAGHVHSAWPDAVAVKAAAGELREANATELIDGALRSAHPVVVAAAVDRSAERGVIVDPFELVCDVTEVAPLVESNPLRVSNAWLPFVAGTPAIVHTRCTPEGSRRHLPYRYPEAVLRMDGVALPGHPGWVVHVPVDRHELLANASTMGNCSGYFDRRIEERDGFLLIVTGPSGQRCNAALANRHDGLDLVEIKDRFNVPAPVWMEAALLLMVERAQSKAASTAPTSETDGRAVSEPPVRRPKPRRRPGGGTRRRPPMRPRWT